MAYRLVARGNPAPAAPPAAADAPGPDAPGPDTPYAPDSAVPEPEPGASQSVYFTADAPLPTPVFDRADFRPGLVLTGPAVIDQLDATTLIYPGDRATVDAAGNLLIELEP